jgi:hypothetical protein
MSAMEEAGVKAWKRIQSESTAATGIKGFPREPEPAKVSGSTQASFVPWGDGAAASTVSGSRQMGSKVRSCGPSCGSATCQGLEGGCELCGHCVSTAGMFACLMACP